MRNKTGLMLLMLMAGVMQAWGETETKTEGFQTATTSTIYTGTRTLTTEQSDCGIGWTIDHGNITATASSAIHGKSCLMRWNSSNPNIYGYAQTTTPIKGLTNVTLNAKNTASIIRMNVFYSTDGSAWKTLVEKAFLTTSVNSYPFDIPDSSPTAEYYIKITVARESTVSGNADLVIDDVVFTYTKNTEVTVEDGATLTINTPTELDKLTIDRGGRVSGSAALTVKDLLLKSSLGAISGAGNSNGKCGEITNRHITTTGDVYFELELTTAAQATYGWYAFAVPFPVSATEGVYFGATQLTNESDYAIMAYHGDIRAQGQYAWAKHIDVLQPGVLYIISVADSDYKTLRFKKRAEASLYSEVVIGTDQMATHEFASLVDPKHAGWNGLGNPYLETAHIGSADLQFLDHEANAFKLRAGDEVTLMVGSAFFYQSDGSAITVTREKIGSIALLPARTPKAIEQTTYEVRLLNANGGEEDRLFLRASEEAKDTYEIGRDVAKMSMGNAKCAQMWVEAYGTQLCAASFPLLSGQATYPLTLSAPAAGIYTIEMKAASDVTLYLTKDGIVLWNLSESAYEVELAQGTTEGYGLLLSAKMPTDIEKVQGDNVQCTKVLIDGQMYVLYEGRMYDMMGGVKE